MKLATLRDGSADGQLIVVSSNLKWAVRATGIAKSLLAALETWHVSEPRLSMLAEELERGRANGAFPLETGALTSPLPRTWQWLDASAFPNHAELMARAFGQSPTEANRNRPLMYQGGSDDFVGPCEDMPLPIGSRWNRFRGRDRRCRRPCSDGNARRKSPAAREPFYDS
jgi:fumarylacetoacetate (FAA) hydrolase